MDIQKVDSTISVLLQIIACFKNSYFLANLQMYFRRNFPVFNIFCLVMFYLLFLSIQRLTNVLCSYIVRQSLKFSRKCIWKLIFLSKVADERKILSCMNFVVEINELLFGWCILFEKSVNLQTILNFRISIRSCCWLWVPISPLPIISDLQDNEPAWWFH